MLQQIIGPLHADSWFHNLVSGADYGMFPPGTKTVKTWISIYTESGRNGLLVVPDSHKKEWHCKVINKDGILKPSLDEVVEGTLVATESGRLIVFNDKLLHGGAINQGYITRVSIEITFVLN